MSGESDGELVFLYPSTGGAITPCDDEISTVCNLDLFRGTARQPLPPTVNSPSSASPTMLIFFSKT